MKCTFPSSQYDICLPLKTDANFMNSVSFHAFVNECGPKSGWKASVPSFESVLTLKQVRVYFAKTGEGLFCQNIRSGFVLSGAEIHLYFPAAMEEHNPDMKNMILVYFEYGTP